MKKKIENNVAEIIITILLIIFISSCGSSQYLCPSYAQASYDSGLLCENCDEID